jgi:hypothetical protein
MESNTMHNLSETGGKAYTALAGAAQFEEEFIGFGAVPSSLVAACRALRAEPNADSAFKALLGEATPAGQLYALCGLYFTDHAYFQEKIAAYRNRGDNIPMQSGCLVLGQRMSAIIENSSPKAIRLGGPDDSLNEWMRKHPEQNNSDIIGGGYPHMFLKMLP